MTESIESNKPIIETREFGSEITALKLLLSSNHLNLSEHEKEVLNIILQRVHPKPETHTTSVAEQEIIDPEQKLIAEALEVISNTPLITFNVFGIGNVLAKPGGDRHGGIGYTLDRDRQHMGSMPSDIVGSLDRGAGEDKNFIENWHIRKINERFYAICRLPFSPSGDTQYCDDFRGGVHFTIALGLKGTYDKVTAEYNFQIPGHSDLENKIQELRSPFLAKIMKSCAEAWVPEYYNYIRLLVKKWDEEHPNEAKRSGLF